MQTKRAKHIVDILLGIGLLLMSYQVVGEAGHEWTGIVMTVFMIIHQILNRKWIAALFKGKYTPLRIVQAFINAALVICFILTALCGISMSVHAVPFLDNFIRASLARRLHLTLSHWCFVLMGLHLGLHVPAMLKGIRSQALRRIGFGLSVPPEPEKVRAIWGTPDGQEAPLEQMGFFDFGDMHFEVYQGKGGHLPGETVLMTSVDTDPSLCAAERKAVLQRLGAGSWKIFGAHGMMKEYSLCVEQGQ